MYGVIGPDHHNWKPLHECSKNKVHSRLSDHKPKTGICERCGKEPLEFNGPRKTNTDYAYIGTNGNWSGNPDDYSELCRSCHLLLDRGKSKQPIHESVLVHPTAQIGDGAHIGEGSIIHAGVVITGYVRIGKRCVVGPNCVIGTPGFGYTQDEETREWKRRPHPYFVVIGDDCEIAASVCIDRGRHRNTVVGDRTKIDHFTHIAHNVLIGKNCLIIAHAMLAGSVTIGDDSIVSPGAVIRDWIDVGKRSHIGLGSVVVKHVDDDTVVYGSPARPHYTNLKIEEGDTSESSAA